MSEEYVAVKFLPSGCVETKARRGFCKDNLFNKRFLYRMTNVICLLNRNHFKRYFSGLNYSAVLLFTKKEGGKYVTHNRPRKGNKWQSADR